MAAASFRVGTKELFLPNVNITLLRTKGLAPNYARFHVPLWFSKLDLRDYLWHAYSVEIVSVRSYVQLQRVQQGLDSMKRPTPQRWHRPQSKKFMTVELVRPFVWPAEPDSYAEWNKEEVEMAEKEGEEYSKSLSPTADTIVNENRRKAMKEQAEALLSGEKSWRPSAYRGKTAEALRR